MTKKHFGAIAEILKSYQSTRVLSPGDIDSPTPVTIDDVANDMADYFQQENPRFDRERFLKACNVK